MKADAHASLVPAWSLGGQVFAFLRGLAADLRDDDRPIGPTSTLSSPSRTYFLHGILAAGDVADIHLATTTDATPTAPTHLVKLAVSADSAVFLDREAAALSRLRQAASHSTYGRYLPDPVETFTTTGPAPRRANVFRYEPGWATLEEVHRQHPALDGHHLAWVFKRLLEVLGFVHRQGMVHAAVLPEHVLISATDHGARLIGWGHRVVVGQPVPAVPERHSAWYPPEVWKKRPAGPGTDLFLAARCVRWLAGVDPLGTDWPDTVPVPMQRFLRSCLLEGLAMRPDDAWALHEEFDVLLRQLYGSPRFHDLPMP